MGVLQVIADQPGSGKTCLVAVLMNRLAAEGRKAGYYKPFSQRPQSDPDVSFFSRYSLADADGPPMPDPKPTPSENGASPLSSSPVGAEIGKAAAELEAATHLGLVEGPDLDPGNSQPRSLCLQLAEMINSRVVILFRYSRNLDLDTVLAGVEPFADRLAGVVINCVAPYRWREIQQGVVAELRSRGLPVLGMVPEDRTMLGVTVQQIADHLGGRWVQEPVNVDALVDRFLIGGNIMDSGQTYFGRFADQAVVTRAERPDIQMASLMAETRCLVLTGGQEPSEYVKAEALQRDVPLILVQGGTMATAEALGGLLDQATAHSPRKIARFTELAEKHLDQEALASALR